MKKKYFLLPFALFVTLLASCSQENSNSMEKITGEVFYRERIMLPETATLKVTLEDVSKMDVPSMIIAEQTQTIKQAPPFNFEITYDTSKIQAQHRYTLRAQIMENDQLRFTSTQHIDPFSENTGKIAIMLKQLPTKNAANTMDVKDNPLSSITNTYWKLVVLNNAPVKMSDEQRKESFFQLLEKDNIVKGFGTCNNITGTYVLTEKQKALKFPSLVTTQKACINNADRETNFVHALNMTESYVIEKEILTLRDKDGQELAQFKAMYFN